MSKLIQYVDRYSLGLKVLNSPPFHLISIDDPSEVRTHDRVDIPHRDNYVAHIRLEFLDLRREQLYIPLRSIQKEADITRTCSELMIKPSHSNQIARFAREFLEHPESEVLFVQCFAGVSRSQSVALALKDHFGFDGEVQWPPVNPFVYESVRESLVTVDTLPEEIVTG